MLVHHFPLSRREALGAGAHHGRTTTAGKAMHQQRPWFHGFALFCPGLLTVRCPGQPWQIHAIHFLPEESGGQVAIGLNRQPRIGVAQDGLHAREARPAHQRVAGQGVAGAFVPADVPGPGRGLQTEAAVRAIPLPRLVRGLGLLIPEAAAAAPANVFPPLDEARARHRPLKDGGQVHLVAAPLAARVREQHGPRGVQPLFQVRDQIFVDGHGRMRAALGGLPPVAAADQQHAPLEVHVPLLEPEEFPLAQRRQNPRGEASAPVVRGVLEGGRHFVGFQNVEAGFHLGARLGGMHGVVPHPFPVFLRQLEDGGELRTDPVDAAGRVGFAARAQAFGELGEVLGDLRSGHLPKGQRAEPGGGARIRITGVRLQSRGVRLRAALMFEVGFIGPRAEIGESPGVRGARDEAMARALAFPLDFERQLLRLRFGLRGLQQPGLPLAPSVFDFGVPANFAALPGAAVPCGHGSACFPQRDDLRRRSVHRGRVRAHARRVEAQRGAQLGERDRVRFDLFVHPRDTHAEVLGALAHRPELLRLRFVSHRFTVVFFRSPHLLSPLLALPSRADSDSIRAPWQALFR